MLLSTVLITVTASYEILILSFATRCRAFHHAVYPDLLTSMRFVWRRNTGTFLSEVTVNFKLKFRNAVLLKILVLYCVVLCALGSTKRYLEGPPRCRIAGLVMNRVSPFKTSVNISHWTWHYIPKEMNVQGLSYPLRNRKLITLLSFLQENMFSHR
jgi:hypothetical protein